MKEFTSQVCTDRHQSQRLLEMGLKPETADMSIITNAVDYDGIKYSLIPYSETNHPKIFGVIPAWSLHRLIELMDVYEVTLEWKFGIYECVISMLEERIKDGLINKEYLKQ